MGGNGWIFRIMPLLLEVSTLEKIALFGREIELPWKILDINISQNEFYQLTKTLQSWESEDQSFVQYISIKFSFKFKYIIDTGVVIIKIETWIEYFWYGKVGLGPCRIHFADVCIEFVFFWEFQIRFCNLIVVYSIF